MDQRSGEQGEKKNIVRGTRVAGEGSASTVEGEKGGGGEGGGRGKERRTRKTHLTRNLLSRKEPITTRGCGEEGGKGGGP